MPLVEINRTINQISRKAQASLYRQSPTEEEGSILLRKWWQVWEGEPPKVEFGAAPIKAQGEAQRTAK